MERERRGKGKERKGKEESLGVFGREGHLGCGVGWKGGREEGRTGGEEERRRARAKERARDSVCAREMENGLVQMMSEEIGRNADQQEHLADGLVHDCILRQLLQLPQHQLRLVFVLQRSQCVRVLVDGAMTI